MSEVETPLPSTPFYDTLSPGKLFRYLTLQPGSEQDDLKCNLHTSLLSDAPPYEAVSYVWGSDVLDHVVTCDGRSLRITQNLSKVLRQLRYPSAERTLWADSICINQQDLKEKGHQVSIMSKIYRSAACVLIYMGEDPKKHGLRVQTLLKEVVAMIEKTIYQIPDPSWDVFPHYTDVTPFEDDERWDSLGALSEQDWFTRGWVVREAALARQGVVVWGRSRLNWASFLLVQLWLAHRARNIVSKHGNMWVYTLTHLAAYIDQNIDKIFVLVPESEKPKTLLLDYLAAGRELHMNDPRDRLYAFLDISLGEESRIEVDPNYAGSALDVYHDFAIRYIEANKGTKILNYIVHKNQSLPVDTPSWVPSWDYLAEGPWLQQTPVPLSSRTGSLPEPTVIGRNILRVRGTILGPVLFRTNMFDKPTITFESVAKIWATVQSKSRSLLHTSSASLRMFFSVLTQDRMDGNPQTWAKLVTRYVECLEAHEDFSERDLYNELDSELSHVNTWISLCTNGKRFMLLEHGYMGLGPAAAEEGDIYGIVFGCTTPCILRRTSQPDYYQFVGPCFIPGRNTYESLDNHAAYGHILGSEGSKDWLNWDVEEQDINLC